jgi:NAD dependent epimerase/dehydratase family enzyme
MPAHAPVLVSGATGLIGTRLVAALLRDGASVRALSRDPARGGLGARVDTRAWNGRDTPVEALAGASAIVHLTGEPVFGGLLSPARRRRIRASRIDSTRSIVSGLRALPASDRPATLVCASAVGYYGSRGDAVLDETAEPGSGFLAEVCVDWEAAAATADALGVRSVSLRTGIVRVRSVSLRTGIVLAREGGALPAMALPFRFGLGGRIGDGRQWIAWIHADDQVKLVRACLESDAYRGPINAVAPEPVTNAQLTRALGRRLRRPALLPVPAFALRLALGDLAVELLGSRRVVPRRALAAGFAFEYTAIDAALRAEIG